VNNSDILVVVCRFTLDDSKEPVTLLCVTLKASPKSVIVSYLVHGANAAARI